MRTRITVFLSVLFAFVLLSATALYFLAANRYKSGFSYGTVINGVKCAGLSVSEVNDLLLADTVFEGVRITSSFTDTEKIAPNDFGFKADYTEDLKGLLFNQNSLLWGKNLFYGIDGISISPVITFDEDKLLSCIGKLNVIREFKEDHVGEIKILFGEKGFYLYDTEKRVLDASKVYALVYDSVKKLESDVAIPDQWIDYPERTPAMEREMVLWDEIKDFVQRDFVFDMGAEKVHADSLFLSSILERNGDDFKRFEDGSLYFDVNKVEGFIDDLCDRYDTYKLPRDFVSVNGEQKHIERSTYGTLIDRKAEKEYFLSAVREGTGETHTPQYTHKAFTRGLDDIGPTRIEIDITRQKLYYIEKGSVVMECDVVTGNPNNGHATPEMVCYVIKKTRDTYLKGEDYRSFVNYWMPIYKTSIGIHDATWQRKFGGERYLTHGSHGCVNMKLTEAEELFDMVTVGVPVLVYK